VDLQASALFALSSFVQYQLRQFFLSLFCFSFLSMAKSWASQQTFEREKEREAAGRPCEFPLFLPLLVLNNTELCLFLCLFHTIHFRRVFLFVRLCYTKHFKLFPLSVFVLYIIKGQHSAGANAFLSLSSSTLTKPPL
jgi:hypothetical protein